MDNEYILEMTGINKSFSGVPALINMNLRVRPGTVHALMGENGAGKSTLMKILLGMYTADSGNVMFKGMPHNSHSIAHSLKVGISMIHQELVLVPEITIAESIFLGREIGKGGFVNDREMQKQTRELYRRIGIDVNPKQKVRELSTANSQMLEIVKAVSLKADLIIMDEPTSSLSQAEVRSLFEIINKLRAAGVAIIYITHRMDEVFEISDEVTVLRDGCHVQTLPACELDTNKLINLMVGRDITQQFPENNLVGGEVLMQVQGYSYGKHFQNVSFDVRRGEVLGFAGLVGAGRSELFNAIFGVTPHDSGEIIIKGKKVKIKKPRSAIKNGIGYVTEDRKKTGIFPPLTVAENIVMPDMRRYAKAMLLSKRAINKEAVVQKERMRIKMAGPTQEIRYLSGGNQQKALLARWLLVEPDILVIDEPTRGIDVGAKYEIHSLLIELARSGKAVIVVSSDLPEVLGVSNRVAVMHEGTLTGILDKEEATQFRVMQYATGEHEEHGERIAMQCPEQNPQGQFSQNGEQYPQ